MQGWTKAAAYQKDGELLLQLKRLLAALKADVPPNKADGSPVPEEH